MAKPPPTTSLLAFSSHEPEAVGSLAFPADPKALERFINVHRFPTLTQLTTTNFNDLLQSPSKTVVVLAAIDSDPKSVAQRDKLAEISRRWKKGGRKFAQPVRFAWVEVDKWTGWLKQSFGISRQDLPAVVVIDTEVSHRRLDLRTPLTTNIAV